MGGVIEYRDNDRADIGWCPDCSTLLTSMTTGGKGLCEKHGWVDANYEGRVWEFKSYVTVFAPTRKSAERKVEQVLFLIGKERVDVTLSVEDGGPEDVTDEWVE